jgi:hypothetical protein
MNLHGQYSIQGPYLNAPDLVLIIGTRQATPTKPKHYILAKGKGEGGKRDKWISSLYIVPGSERMYSFDYSGHRYVLEFSDSEGTAEIKSAPAWMGA